MERVQEISLKRLMLGVAVQALAYGLLSASSDPRALCVFASLGLAGIVIYCAVPPPNVSAALLVVFGAFIANGIATLLVIVLVWDKPESFTLAFPGFLGATLFAMAVHRALFQSIDLPTSLVVGLSTLPASLSVRLVSSHWHAVLLYHAAWLLFFTGGFALVCMLHGRTTRSP